MEPGLNAGPILTVIHLLALILSELSSSNVNPKVIEPPSYSTIGGGSRSGIVVPEVRGPSDSAIEISLSGTSSASIGIGYSGLMFKFEAGIRILTAELGGRGELRLY